MIIKEAIKMKLLLYVDGMHCEGCENRIKNVIKGLDNIISVSANYKKKIVEIEYENSIDVQLLKDKINNLGFTVMENKDE